MFLASTSTHFLRLAAIPMAIGVSFPAHAVAVASGPTVSEPYVQLYNVAINSLGFRTGELIRFGANAVDPGGAGTTGSALAPNGNLLNIFYSPGPAVPNFYTSVVPYQSSLVGEWSLSFSNSAGTTGPINVGLPAAATEIKFIDSVTLSGSSSNPTFSWAPPSGAAIDGYRVNIYDRSLISSTPGSRNLGIVVAKNIGQATSYTVDGADFTVPGYEFKLGRNYSIEISALQTRDDSSTNLDNSNVYALSRVYADFTPTSAGGPPVNLPVVTANGAFQFNIAVTPGQTYYIDPLVATGYDYRIGVGDPNFQSVLLPTTIGDGLYDLFGFDANDLPTLLMHDLPGGQVYDFGSGGVRRFKVLGIEASADLDPANPTAFVTGLTFAGAGQFTGTQAPLTTFVPEPSVAGLFGLGLGLLALCRRRIPD